MILSMVEIGKNLQTAIVAVGMGWAFAFAVWALCKYLLSRFDIDD